MSMVVGLMSGKEFIVEDRCFMFQDPTTGRGTKVFIGKGQVNKRIITVPDEVIEYVDEELTDERMQALVEASERDIEVQYDDNYR